MRNPRILVRWAIHCFVAHYRIDMHDHPGSPDDYPSLAAFFCRPLDPKKRLIGLVPDAVIAPADSILTMAEVVHEDIATQVKGITYRLSALIGENLNFAAGYLTMTFYLSPRDYHRFHQPLDAELVAAMRTGARLYPVNPFSTRSVANLFVDNERVILKMRTGNHYWYYIAVGAAFVGGILTTAGELLEDDRWYFINRQVTQGKEIGRFEMGSTIILLLPASLAGRVVAATGDVIRAGDTLSMR